MHIVHLNYGFIRYNWEPCIHMVRCPDGTGKTFDTTEELNKFLKNKKWRYSAW